MKQKLETITWKTDSGTLTLCPQHGRVLQARVGKHDAFWVNPRWSGDWNVGGDRLWISPEVDWFWKTLKQLDPSQYEVPSKMDDHRWHVEKLEKSSCRVRHATTLQHQHHPHRVRIELTRQFTQVGLPDATGFRSAVAYGTENSLRVLDGPRGQRLGLWSLLQLPAGGSLFIPSPAKPVFRDYFAPVESDHWQAKGSMLKLRISGTKQYKIGIRPEATTGRLAYLRKLDRDHLVILRVFFPQPWRRYVDVPMNALRSRGDVAQVYNDNGVLGDFGEMEHHSPALTIGAGNDRLVDANLTIIGWVAATDLTAWKRHWLR